MFKCCYHEQTCPVAACHSTCAVAHVLSVHCCTCIVSALLHMYCQCTSLNSIAHFQCQLHALGATSDDRSVEALNAAAFTDCVNAAPLFQLLLVKATLLLQLKVLAITSNSVVGPLPVPWSNLTKARLCILAARPPHECAVQCTCSCNAWKPVANS